jgi:hypothetical protein
MDITVVSDYLNDVQKEAYFLCEGVSRSIYKNGKKLPEGKRYKLGVFSKPVCWLDS